jgi:hypothetical protein
MNSERNIEEPEVKIMIRSNGRRLLLGLAGAFAVTIAAIPSTSLADGRHARCRTVHGRFTSVPVAPPACTSPVGLCTSGQLTGTLNGGTYAFTMNTLTTAPEPEAQFVSFFSGISTVTTRSGRVYRGVDTGAMNMNPPGTEGSGKFSTLLSFTDGGSGFLHIRGTLDFVTGNASGDYKGEICSQ